MMSKFPRRMVRFGKDESGAAFIYFTMTLPVLIALTSMAVDLGYVWYVKTRLQVAADMGALAGASKLYTDNAKAVTDLATTYVNSNLPSDWTGGGKTTASGKPKIECLTTISNMGLTCSSLSGGNALRVTVNAKAPLFFATMLGFKSINLSAEAMVTGGGSAPPPLNVAIVLDATASMAQSLGTSCGSLTSPKKVECASLAAKTLMTKLWASVDQVALYAYPAFDTASKDIITCKTGASGSANWINYSTLTSTPNYRLVDFNDTFTDKGTPPTTGLDVTNPLVKAFGKTPTAAPKNDTTTCNGLNSAAIGVGTSIADAIVQAQNDLIAANDALVAKGEPKRQNVLIVLSDGDANGNSKSLLSANPPDDFRPGTDLYGKTSSSWVVDVHRMMDQCQAAVTAAKAAAATGTWVYSIAFAAPSTAKGSCFTDRPVTTVIKTATSTPALTSADNIVTTRSCSSSNKCKAIASAPTSQITSTIKAQVASTSQVAVTTWGKTIVTTCTKPDGSTSGTCTTTLTPSKVQTDTYDLTKYDTTACATMRAIASDPSKFYSTDGNTKCASSANPNFTDLVKIFNNVAASIMKKRRIPSSTT
ncbi:hypothetical protein DK847_13185 [Aestuariivirga litoralis]|uniref:Putative Flp pilus-assembly TadG-like N-terminal domain-containing protein n=1 Tax=Aestuariivirga litoralis TaxID=2650924 RepID=A0A2W2B7T3_9HYPH|nr:TadE/TadG family type IV pilus assembly protein [Aestuariivirga litoralis]PZF76158.1 hypothetical protein DK847_13185 [Aestuariivirga litoralis]